VSRIGVFGAGSWGTALAVHLAQQGHDVTLWARDPAFVADLQAARENRPYLPGTPLPPTLQPTHSLEEALDDAAIALVVVPSHGFRPVVERMRPHLAPATILVSATKGIEQARWLRMSEVCHEVVGADHPVAVLSGPSFAAEVARGLPTAVLVASTNPGAAQQVQHEFRGPAFRLYASDDVIGVEVGGALKNVMAIAAGVADALGLGQNARAALITRGLAEMSRLALAAGGRRDTLAGLSGIGDLVLTCTGGLSRNHHVGFELGRGRPLADVLGEMRMVAEGVRTTEGALALGRCHGVELPLSEKVHQIMAGDIRPREALVELMLRPQKAEG